MRFPKLDVESFDQKILREIREEMPEHKYGLRAFLKEPIYADIFRGGLVIRKKRGYCKNGYDCADSLIATKRILDKNGIFSEAFRGTDEDGLFKGSKGTGHNFVIAKSSIIVDPVPLYDIIGAKHIPVERIPDEKIPRASNVISLNDGVVIDFHREDGYRYFSTARILGFYYGDFDKKTDIVNINVVRKGEKPEEACRIFANINEQRIKELRANGIDPLERDASLSEVNKRLDELESKGAIEIGKVGWDLNLKGIGNLEEKEKNYKNVSNDLKEIILRYMDIFVYFIENASFAGYGP